MSNDLISREALREDLRRFFPTEVLEGIEPKTLFAQIMHDIDNAPTVEQKYYERVVANITLDQNQLDEIAEKVKAEIGEDKGKKKCVDCEHALYLTKRDEELGLVGGCEIGFPCNDDSEDND